MTPSEAPGGGADEGTAVWTSCPSLIDWTAARGEAELRSQHAAASARAARSRTASVSVTAKQTVQNSECMRPSVQRCGDAHAGLRLGFAPRDHIFNFECTDFFSIKCDLSLR